MGPVFLRWVTHDRLVGKIDLSECAVDGFGGRTTGGVRDATEGAHMPIVPHGRVEERVVLLRGEGEPPAEGIRARGHVNILQQDTNVLLHLRDMERCSDWVPRASASPPAMTATHCCTRLGRSRFHVPNVVS